MNNVYSFYTIGHAVRNLDEFIYLLKNQNITLLADVRSVPRSRANPEYNESLLPKALSPHNIGYVHIPELGGFRPKSKTVSFETNALWKNNSFHSYADYAMSEDFQKGLETLLRLGKSQSVAIMCAEMLWWRCHRRIITDYLLINGKEVFHIINENNVKSASLTNSAHVASSGVYLIMTYPQE